MEKRETSFRTAAFGGFQKEDVYRYIETSARTHAARVAQLEQELGESRRVREELETRASADESRLNALREERDALAAERAALTERAARADAAEAELSAAREELTALREKAAKMESDAKAYERLKDYTAGLELEAQQRAHAIEDDARRRADALTEKKNVWVSRVRESYGKIRACLGEMTAELDTQDTALGNLTQNDTQ